MTADGDDARVVAGMVRALRPGGRLAVSAFNADFVVKDHDGHVRMPTAVVSHERTEIRNPAGEVREADLWTGCYTPRELRLLLAAEPTWTRCPGRAGSLRCGDTDGRVARVPRGRHTNRSLTVHSRAEAVAIVPAILGVSGTHPV